MAPALPLLDPILAIRIALPGPVQLLPAGASSATSLAGPSVGGATFLFSNPLLFHLLSYALASPAQLELQTGPRG
jgi:hypothetical protein